jgi:hypothetical protein
VHVCVNIYLLSLIFVELENRCILAALPYALGGMAASKQIPGELFFEVVNVQ